jgi:hypothetical protein
MSIATTENFFIARSRYDETADDDTNNKKILVMFHGGSPQSKD